MPAPAPAAVHALVADLLGSSRASELLASLAWPELPSPTAEAKAPRRATRLEVAWALAALLYDDLLERVPYAEVYLADRLAQRERIGYDHGALRTVAAPSGALPAGAQAIARVLEPLGYQRVATYDLSRIGMTGYAYAHADLPEDVPQYFVSELHPERFSPEFQVAALRVIESSRDPLSAAALRKLARLAEDGALTLAEAAKLLPELVACFDRQHAAPRLEDYELLLAESAEMAWIATEGNAFNHATDRVEDVDAVAKKQRELGRPIKATVEVSDSGRVRQTALRAAPVERAFISADGSRVLRTVPGSFQEFISRARLADGALDLAFDAGNAQAIFQMTTGRAASGARESNGVTAARAEALLAELRERLGSGAVLTEPSDRAAYERGWRYGAGQALAVVKPSSTHEVAATLAAAFFAGVRVQPIGANTGLVGASNPDASGDMLVLSLERLSRTIEVDAVSGTALVDAGVTLARLQEALEPHGLWFPIDLGADPQLGGMVATNTGGTRLLRYGDVRANLLGVEVVLADGTLVERLAPLRKNNTGLDWKQLFVGTSGSYGVVTRVTVQLAPKPRQRVAVLACLRDGDAALALLAHLRGRVGEALSAFEVLSEGAIEAVLRNGSYERDPFAGSVPAYAALVELSSAFSTEVVDLESALSSALEEHVESSAGEGVLDVLMGSASDFWHLRHQVSESLAKEGHLLGLDVSVPPSAIAAFTGAVSRELAARAPDVRVCDFGHWGDGGTHLNLVLPKNDDAPQRAAALQALVYRIAVDEFDGTFSAEHGVGPHNRDAYALHVPAVVRAAAAALKRQLDPEWRLGTVDLG